MSTAVPDVRTWLIQRVAAYLRRSPGEIDPDMALAEYGLDSLSALAVAADIEDRFGIELAPETTWDHPTVNALSDVLVALIEERTQS